VESLRIGMDGEKKRVHEAGLGVDFPTNLLTHFMDRSPID
jgi:hypothetical protein